MQIFAESCRIFSSLSSSHYFQGLSRWPSAEEHLWLFYTTRVRFPAPRWGSSLASCRQLLRFLQAPALKHTSPLAETHLHIIKRFERILYLVTCTCVYRSANLCTWIQYMQKPEKGIGICGTGVTDCVRHLFSLLLSFDCCYGSGTLIC